MSEASDLCGFYAVLSLESLRQACEPFRCDTFGCESAETDALDKACAEADSVRQTTGLLQAAKNWLATREAAARKAALEEATSLMAKREMTVRMDTLRAAGNAVCFGCRHSIPHELLGEEKELVHLASHDVWLPCHAAKIRSLMQQPGDTA